MPFVADMPPPDLPGFLGEAWQIWRDGGLAMFAIAVDALVMFGIGLRLWLCGQATAHRSVPEKMWRLWIEHPSHREGPVGRLIEAATTGSSIEAGAAAFAGVRKSELAPFERDLRVMRACIAAAPLFGLFGTVTGMLTTFGALAVGSGGDKTMAAIADGIAEALITTETGLVVALPGLFFQYQIGRRKDRYAAFLAHLETVCMQFLHRRRPRHPAAA